MRNPTMPLKILIDYITLITYWYRRHTRTGNHVRQFCDIYADIC